MQCPVDGEILQMTERSGVEIDYCPRCRGVWLDRGELGIVSAFLGHITPALAGNVLGGTGIFATLTYAQVHQEV